MSQTSIDWIAFSKRRLISISQFIDIYKIKNYEEFLHTCVNKHIKPPAEEEIKIELMAKQEKKEPIPKKVEPKKSSTRKKRTTRAKK